MSQPSVGRDPAADGRDPAALRALFDAEVLAAALVVTDDDRERLFAMWSDHLPTRDRLRAAELALPEEPSFVEKPTLLGGGALPARATEDTPPGGGA